MKTEVEQINDHMLMVDILKFDIARMGKDSLFRDSKTGSQARVDTFKAEDYLSRIIEALDKDQLAKFDKSLDNNSYVEEAFKSTDSPGKMLSWFYANKKSITNILIEAITIKEGNKVG
jgi:hypothetical protein